MMENRDQLLDSKFKYIIIEAHRLGNTGLMSSQELVKYLAFRLERCIDIEFKSPSLLRKTSF